MAEVDSIDNFSKLLTGPVCTCVCFGVGVGVMLLTAVARFKHDMDLK